MPFSIEDFVKLRPYLYHLTSEVNLGLIGRTSCLFSASYWMQRGDCEHLCRQKRLQHASLVIEGEEIVIRDQSPLYEGKMKLEGGFIFADFIESLNARVFFWPGDETGPNGYGLRHFERYRTENPSILRIPTRDIINCNIEREPLFCRYNSGSPRPSNGMHPPRGPKTFVAATEATFRASNVVEVTFEDSAILPTTAVASSLDEWSWQEFLVSR